MKYLTTLLTVLFFTFLIATNAICNNFEYLVWKVYDVNSNIFKGTCFTISKDGYFLTAAHILEASAILEIRSNHHNYSFKVIVSATLCELEEITVNGLCRDVKGMDVALLKLEDSEVIRFIEFNSINAYEIPDIEIRNIPDKQYETQVIGYYSDDIVSPKWELTQKFSSSYTMEPFVSNNILARHNFLIKRDASTKLIGVSGGICLSNNKIIGIQSCHNQANSTNYIVPIFEKEIKKLLFDSVPPSPRIKHILSSVKQKKKIPFNKLSNIDLNYLCYALLSIDKSSIDVQSRCLLNKFFAKPLIDHQLAFVIQGEDKNNFRNFINCLPEHYKLYAADLLHKASDKYNGSANLLELALENYDGYFASIDIPKTSKKTLDNALYSFADANIKMASLSNDPGERVIYLNDFFNASALTYKIAENDDNYELLTNSAIRVADYFNEVKQYDESKMFYAIAAKHSTETEKYSNNSEFVNSLFESYKYVEAFEKTGNEVHWLDVNSTDLIRIDASQVENNLGVLKQSDLNEAYRKLVVKIEDYKN